MSDDLRVNIVNGCVPRSQENKPGYEKVLIVDRDESGSLTVRKFIEEIYITPELLVTEKSFMRTFVEFIAANGRAVYELVEYERDTLGGRFLAKRVTEQHENNG